MGRSPALRRLYLDAHRLVLETVPEVAFSIDRDDGEIGYGARQFGYNGWRMAALAPYANWASLAFIRGVGLDDPQGLLEGTGTVTRHVKLRSVEELDEWRDAIRRLLEAAVRLDQDDGQPPIP
jgi:hypothetical protein